MADFADERTGDHLASFGRHLPCEPQEEHHALLKHLSAAS